MVLVVGSLLLTRLEGASSTARALGRSTGDTPERQRTHPSDHTLFVYWKIRDDYEKMRTKCWLIRPFGHPQSQKHICAVGIKVKLWKGHQSRISQLDTLTYFSLHPGSIQELEIKNRFNKHLPTKFGFSVSMHVATLNPTSNFSNSSRSKIFTFLGLYSGLDDIVKYLIFNSLISILNNTFEVYTVTWLYFKVNALLCPEERRYLPIYIIFIENTFF